MSRWSFSWGTPRRSCRRRSITFYPVNHHPDTVIRFAGSNPVCLIQFVLIRVAALEQLRLADAREAAQLQTALGASQAAGRRLAAVLDAMLASAAAAAQQHEAGQSRDEGMAFLGLEDSDSTMLRQAAGPAALAAKLEAGAAPPGKGTGFGADPVGRLAIAQLREVLDL